MRKLFFAAVSAAILSIAGGASAATFLYTADGGAVTAAEPTVGLKAPTLSFAATVASSPHATIGGATESADGSVLLDSTKAPFQAGISFGVPSGLFVGDLTDFSTDYNFAGGCASGVPQLVLVTPRGNIYVSLGAAANFSCASGVRNSSSFLRLGTPVDSGRIESGTTTDTWGHAKSEFDRLRVTEILLVTAAANQSVVVSNMQLILNPRGPGPTL